jgi:hypothetical protein
LAHRGILTGENLKRRRWEGPHRCPLCTQEEETIDHLLLSCTYSKEVWRLTLGLPTPPELPQGTSSLLHNWNSLCPFQTTKNGQISNLWSTIPKFVLSKIWLERNNWMFRETKRIPTHVATKIKALLGESAPTSVRLRTLGH